MRGLRVRIFVVVFIVLALMSEACAERLGEILNPKEETVSYEVTDSVTTPKATETKMTAQTDSEVLSKPNDYLMQEMEEFQQLQNTVAEVMKKQDINYVLGEYTEDGYISKYANYYFTTPEGCELATQEELLVEAGYSEADIAINYEDILEKYVQQEYIVDLYAFYPDTGSNLIYTAEGVAESVVSTEHAMDLLLDSMRQDSAEILEVYGGMEEVEIAGTLYLKGVVKFKLGYQDMILCREFYETCDKHVLDCIVVEYVEGNEAERDALLGAMQEHITQEETIKALEAMQAEQEEQAKEERQMEIAEAIKQQAESQEYVFGSFTEDGYASGYLGYSVVTPEGWEMAEYRELGRVSCLDGEVTEKNFVELMEARVKEKRVCDVRLRKPDTDTYVNMWVQATRLEDYNNDWDFYLEVIASSKQTVAERREKVCTIVTEKESIKIAGEEFVGTIFQIEEDGEIWIEAEYWAEIKDKMLKLEIEYAPGNEAERDEAIAAFSALNK